jgi:ABC-type transporter Mla subunit MlaD
MRRIAALIVVGAAAAALVSFSTAAGGEEGSYEVRAIFDAGGFMVPGEDVRIAGANVGSVSSVDVTRPGETVHADGSEEPGKAVIVMRIDDPAFQDFREDAQCEITPQSLLGEKFVECRQTAPRAPGTEPPPPLEEIPDGEEGAGQHLLPVEQNAKSVDLDLVNNIMRQPYVDRFRLILNDLGAGLAARGDDLDSIIERADPALRQTNEVVAILARQSKALDRLATNGDRVLGPLARERERVTGFINNAEVAAAATAERRADLEAQFERLPSFLRELRLTMRELDGFNLQAEPVISDFGDAAPALTRVNKALEPFSDNGTRALKSLGDAADEVGPVLVAADPILIDLRELAEETRPMAQTLAELLTNLRRTGGYEFLTRTIFNFSAAINGFDTFGHFLRTLLPINNCVDYEIAIEPGCESFFTPGPTSGAAPKQKKAPEENPLEGLQDALEATAEPPTDGEAPTDAAEPPIEPADPPTDGTSEPTTADAKLFLDYLVGDTAPASSGKGKGKRRGDATGKGKGRR